jgi:hypothetical protein
MGGLVIDIYIGFLIRAAILLWRKAASREWLVITGTVRASSFEQGYGGDYALIRYQYKTSGERHEGVIKKPYLSRNYGEAYVRRFPAGCEVPIRVNSNDRSKSMFVKC